SRDWSSDVCSSDLRGDGQHGEQELSAGTYLRGHGGGSQRCSFKKRSLSGNGKKRDPSGGSRLCLHYFAASLARICVVDMTVACSTTANASISEERTNMDESTSSFTGYWWMSMATMSRTASATSSSLKAGLWPTSTSVGAFSRAGT